MGCFLGGKAAGDKYKEQEKEKDNANDNLVSRGEMKVNLSLIENMSLSLSFGVSGEGPF